MMLSLDTQISPMDGFWMALIFHGCLLCYNRATFDESLSGQWKDVWICIELCSSLLETRSVDWIFT